MASVQLTYRTFDELLSSVLSDMKTFDQEGLIDPQDLIKVAQYVNKDLSLKINPEKEGMIELKNGVGRLPTDIHKLNYATVCHEGYTTTPIIHGRHTEDVVTKCGPITTKLTECGDSIEVVQTYDTETRHFKRFYPLQIETSTIIKPGCPNLHEKCEDKAYIKDGWIYTNIKEGYVYVNYESNMEDEDGNLLVLDHDKINFYYEYALKVRILENMLLNGEQVADLYKLMEQKRSTHRKEAKCIANMSEFSELKAIWQANRVAQHRKYYDYFKTNYYRPTHPMTI